MSAGTPAVKWFFKWKSSPRVVSLLIVFVVFCCTLIVRHFGWLQFLEFQAYDFFIRHQPKAATSDPIVLVEMTEADIHSPLLDYPIYDVNLAALLRSLEADQPAVIGLDIWRDMPVPKSGAGLHEFNQVLQANNVSLKVTYGKGTALFVDQSLVATCSLYRKLLRQQIISPVASPHAYDLSALAEVVYVFTKKYVHVCHLMSPHSILDFGLAILEFRRTPALQSKIQNLKSKIGLNPN